MTPGLIHHLDLTVTDLERSVEFYEQVLERLGYARTFDYAGEVPCWELRRNGTILGIGLHRARTHSPHDRYAPGLHHVAFHAASRRDVDEFHEFLRQANIRILDAPAEYDYTPGYYAVFFCDPDGLKLELVHEPRLDGR